MLAIADLNITKNTLSAWDFESLPPQNLSSIVLPRNRLIVPTLCPVLKTT